MIRALILTALLVVAANAVPEICAPQKGTCNFECVYATLPNKVVVEIRTCPVKTPNEWAKMNGLDTIPSDTLKGKK